MFDQHFGQTLLVQPSVPFTEIEHVLQQLGWTREDGGGDETCLINGEPEFASWTRNGVKPFVIYTFNPVVFMRVLDVATLPPAMRAKIAAQLPLLDERKISKLFESDDIKEKLLALWAAQETERVDLLVRVEKLQQDKEPAIAEQAREISKRLKAINQARVQMMTQLRMLAETAPQLIVKLSDPGFVASLKPTKNDLKKLFDENLLAPLLDTVDTIYRQNPRITTVEPDANIEVIAAPAGLLRWPNMFSDKFPGGYRDIAGWMNPHHVWLTWTIQSRSGDSVRYDGLVWLEDRWLWLPKIFRHIIPYLMTDAMSSSSKH